MFTKREDDFVEKLTRWAKSIGINLDREQEQLWIVRPFCKVRKITGCIMRYVKTTRLEHGIVIHYQNSRGNIESHFIENDSSDKVWQKKKK